MGKSKKKDRMYVTAKEYSMNYGGQEFKSREGEGRIIQHQKLPYHSCAISLQPLQDPVALRVDKSAVLFDIVNIVPFLRKYKKNPITGQPASTKELIRVHLHKNKEGKFQCPITFKTFTDHSNIVLIAPSGNVYSKQAVTEMNIQQKNYTDLLTGEPFKKSDILVVQDPQDPEHRDLSTFYHIQKNLRVKEEEESGVRMGGEVRKVMEEVNANEEERKRKEEEEDEDEDEDEDEGDEEEGEKKKKEKKKKEKEKKKSTQYASASFTCTGFTPIDEVAQPKIVTKKGYVTLVTNLGKLNLELDCDAVPLACENFLTLCARGYYNGVVFHRNIKKFMIQGGDPTGTGRGGASIWGKPFKDEFVSRFTHTGRGILSMANSGRNTNGSQFYITYKSCHHLDNQHTIFGRVVGGLAVLDTMEEVPSDHEDRPMTEIKILTAVVFIDPFQKLEEIKKKEEESEKKEKEEILRQMDRGKWFSQPSLAPKSSSSSVGKYLNLKQSSEGPSTPSSSGEGGSLKRKLELKEGKERKEKRRAIETSNMSTAFDKW